MRPLRSPLLYLVLVAACGADDDAGADRCDPPCPDAVADAAVCTEDAWRCQGSALEWCHGGAWEEVVDCAAEGGSCQPAETREGFACLTDDSCSGNVTRCQGQLLQACSDGAWQDVETCPARCDVVDDFARCVIPEPCLLSGQQRCNGTILQECVGNWWTDFVDCAADGLVCEPILDLDEVVRCAAPTLGAELELCTGLVDGTCEAGLVCVAPDESSVERCFASCDPELDGSCGAGGECASAAGAPDGGVCFDATGVRDGPCGEDDATECGPDAGSCTRTDTSPDVYRCKLRCDSVDIGTRAGCPTGELCLASTFFFSQSPEQRCAYRGEPGVCDEDNGYLCDTVSGVTKCIRWQGWCGELQPLVGAFDGDSLAAYAAAGHGCEDTDDHRMCGIVDADGLPADVSCRDLGSHGGQRVYGCIAFCTGDEGQPDLDCGEGFTCGQPSHDDARYFQIARDAGGDRIICDEGSDEACDVEAGYRCHGPFGDDFNCATPSKVCLTAPEP